MLYSHLAQNFQKLDSTTGRLEMTSIIVQLLKTANQEEISKIIYLSLGRLGPKYDNLEFNMADKLVLRSIAQAFQIPVGKVTEEYKKLGDVGEVAFSISVLHHQDKPSLKETKSKLNFFPKTEGKNIHTPKPEVNWIYQQLVNLAQDSGSGSQERKIFALASLLKLTDPVGAKYLARIPVGKLRLGFGEMTFLDALSWLVAGDKSLHDSLEEAYNVQADVGRLAQNIKTQIANYQKAGQRQENFSLPEYIKQQLASISCRIGAPVVPALCQRLKTFDEIIDKLGKVAVEPKYDGTRLQIHWQRSFPTDHNHFPKQSPKPAKIQSQLFETPANAQLVEQSDKSFVKSFTRNLEENSAMFPELQQLGNYLPSDIESVILDCEAIGYDPDTGKQVPFQITMTRKRKHEIADQQSKVPIKFMIFDILYMKRKKTSLSSPADLHNLPLKQRRKFLEELFNQKQGQHRSSKTENSTALTPHLFSFIIAPQTVTTDPQVCRDLHHRYLDQGLEGVIVKKWDSPYTPGRKGWHWVKVKQLETAAAGLADTLDCVVMGYYRGRGQRTKLGIGAFLVGVLEHKSKKLISQAKFLSISKIGTGLTEEQFRDLTKRLKPLEVKTKPLTYQISKELLPDVWVEPSLIVEIAADNLTESKTHTSGYGLRFPRLVKLRNDKDITGTTTLKEVKELYELQK